MASSLGKVMPFVKLNRSAELYGATEYPVGGTNPPDPYSGPDPPTTAGQGPLLGTHYINLLNLRDYYKLPYPPVTPLASPPVIGIVSFGGGIYGQPVSSGKYSGFWKCTDISGANGAPIQILVSPINGAINAPNADDGGATLENTVDVATVNAFYGMINQGRDAPVYTPPVIILYIAPSDDIEEVYKTFYTVLKNPVICNGQSYLPSVVCCSWGAPEISWTQKMAFPPSGLEEDVDNDPNPAGIAIMNEINDLLADATRRGINICVASGDIRVPGEDVNGDSSIDQGDLKPSQIMFPASSPYVTCVGGSSVFFPNGAVRNFNNPGEFAWARANGGVSNAFPIPDYQSNLPGSALISANAFLAASENTSSLIKDSLGSANVKVPDAGVISDLSGVSTAATLSSLTKDDALEKAQIAYDAAVIAYNYAKNAGGTDATTLQLQLAMKSSNTALTAAKENSKIAKAALADAQDAVVKAGPLNTLMVELAIAYEAARVATADSEVYAPESNAARDAALLVLNNSVKQAASSVFAPELVASLTENVSTAANAATGVLNDLVNPYDPFNPVILSDQVPPVLPEIYKGSSTAFKAKANLDALVTRTTSLITDISMADQSGNNAYANSIDNKDAAITNLSSDKISSVAAYATFAGRLATTVNDNTAKYMAASLEWSEANTNYASASQELSDVLAARIPDSTAEEITTARSRFTEALDLLTKASVVLADTDVANLLATEKLSDVLSNVDTKINDTDFVDMVNSSLISADLVIKSNNLTGTTDMFYEDVGESVIFRLSSIAKIADDNAIETKRCYAVWSTEIGKSVKNIELCIVASEETRAAAIRTVNAAVALKTLLDSDISSAVATWTNTAAKLAAATAVSDARGALSAINTAIAGSATAVTAPVTAKLTDAYGTLTNVAAFGTIRAAKTAVDSALTAFGPVPSNNLSISVKELVNSVFILESTALYTAFYAAENEETSINATVANFVEGLNATEAIYDQFTELNIKAKKANDLAVIALAAAKLANERLALATTGLGSTAVTTRLKNKIMKEAAKASSDAANAMIEYNNLVSEYASITPSLVDAAIRSQESIKTAVDKAKLATASADPAPVTPQMVKALQGLVLKAKASTQLALESDPTNANLQATLALWNTAVSAGAAAVAGIADMLDTDTSTAANEPLLALFKSFAGNTAANGNPVTPTNRPTGAVQLAWLLGTNSSTYNFPVTNDMYLSAKAAYDFAVNYFALGVNGGNLRYLMTMANNKIVEAWRASQASLVATPEGSANDRSRQARSAAQGFWELASNKVASIVSLGFESGNYAVRYSVTVKELHDAVYKAYQKTTGNNLDDGDVYEGTIPTDLSPYSDSSNTSDAYITALAAYKSFNVAYDAYNTDFLQVLQTNSNEAAIAKNNAQVAIALAIAAAARTNAAAKKSAQESKSLATSTQGIQDLAALAAAEAAFSAADNVNMYRCVPDIAMHSNADDLPIVFRLNGGNVYVGGTSVAAAMFTGFLGVVQSHNPINYFMNPVLYNNFTYPSPLFYDISGTSELLNEGNVTGTYEWVVSDKLDKMPNSLLPLVHGSYNPRVGLGSIRADALSSFLEAPQLVTYMVTGPYPVVTDGDDAYTYINLPNRVPIQTVVVYPGTTSDVYVFVSSSSAYNTNVTWSCSSPYNATVTQTLEAYGPVEINSPEEDTVTAMVYRARVTGVVPVDPLAQPPVITIASTDGSNVFTTINVSVRPAIQVTGVSISAVGETKNPANTVLSLGNTLQLIATVTPALATNKHVYWWSSNMSVVNVDINGLLTPLAPGQVTIKATTVNNNISASISVYVPTPMTGITASPTMITLNPNTLIYPLKNSQLIKALVTPANADYKHLTWSIVSSHPLPLPAGTTDQHGTALFYGGDNTINTPVISLPTPDGIVLKRDSNGNITDNTQDMVTAVSNGMAVINVSTSNATDSVYGTYSANITVNVVTPITNVTLQQTNMVIGLNPQSAIAAVNPSVNAQYGTQYGTTNQNLTLPFYNAVVPDRNLPEEYKVTATLFPEFPSNMNLIWTSSNPKVAIISNNTPAVLNTTASDPNFNLFQVSEMITPLANGSTVIKVTTADGNKVAMVNVTVTTPVTNIALSPMPVTLNPGAQYALQATVLPTTASNADLVWDTTNSAVATVDQNGVVTAVASGSCGISVSTVDGDYTAMATINVVTPLVGVSLVLNTPTPIHIGDMVQILVVMTPTTASNQQFTWTVTNGMNGSIFTNGPAQNGNIVYLDAAQAGSAVFTVTTADGNKQANLALTVVNY